MKTKMKCFELETKEFLKCSSVNNIKYCERKTTQKEICIPDSGDSVEILKRFDAVLKGLKIK